MSRGRAKLAMGEGMAAWLLEAPGGFGEADYHVHHAIQLSITFAGHMAMTCEGVTMERPIVGVASDTRHKFSAAGLAGFLFVEPESALGRGLTAKLFGDSPISALDDADFAAAVAPLGRAIDDALTPDAMLGIARAALTALACHAPAMLPDPRIDRVIRQALEKPGLTLDEAAAACGLYLSPSRLRHLFVEQTGLAYKTYMVWQRLYRALDAYAQGSSLTEAAHHAQFADSAHFSRVFRRYFGLPATTLTRI